MASSTFLRTSFLNLPLEIRLIIYKYYHQDKVKPMRCHRSAGVFQPVCQPYGPCSSALPAAFSGQKAWQWCVDNKDRGAYQQAIVSARNKHDHALLLVHPSIKEGYLSSLIDSALVVLHFELQDFKDPNDMVKQLPEGKLPGPSHVQKRLKVP